jgi:hypothetical protein
VGVKDVDFVELIVIYVRKTKAVEFEIAEVLKRVRFT